MKWWNENKLKFSLIPALVFWVVSVLCFVFGLSFKNPIGYSLLGWDISMWIAVALSIANTWIQIIGNDQEREKMGAIMYLGWMASYVLGIGSNVNTLLGILNIDSKFLEWSIAGALGSMIEVMPERLLVTFLKSMSARPKQENQGHQNQGKFNSPQGFGRSNQSNQPQKSNYKAQHRPVFVPPQKINVPTENEGFVPFHYDND